jgi:uncharacterized membrane protein
VTTARLEAFSDGVFAIAITLLVLEIHVPDVEGGDLAHALVEQWPAYASYVVSFLTVGIIWTNHHAVLDHIARADRAVLYLNLLLLLFVALIPWPTNLLAEYMREGGEAERVAALVYAGVFMLMGIAFGLLWARIARSEHLLDPTTSHAEAHARTLRFRIGAPIYGVALLAALVSAPLCLIICALSAVYYALPGWGAMTGPAASREA